MNSTVLINSQDSLDKFLEKNYSFHDCLLKYCRLITPGFVDTKGAMWGDCERFNAALYFQSQFVNECPPFILFAKKVGSLTLGETNEFDPVVGKWAPNKVSLFNEGYKGKHSFYIEAEAFCYRIFPQEFLDNKQSVLHIDNDLSGWPDEDCW